MNHVHTNLETTELVATFVAKKSVTFVISGVASALIPVAKKNQKVQMAIGVYVLCGILNEPIDNFVKKQINAAVGVYQAVKTHFNDTAE